VFSLNPGCPCSTFNSSSSSREIREEENAPLPL
jgi:hypothetical protein